LPLSIELLQPEYQGTVSLHPQRISRSCIDSLDSMSSIRPDSVTNLFNTETVQLYSWIRVKNFPLQSSPKLKTIDSVAHQNAYRQQD